MDVEKEIQDLKNKLSGIEEINDKLIEQFGEVIELITVNSKNMDNVIGNVGELTKMQSDTNEYVGKLVAIQENNTQIIKKFMGIKELGVDHNES